MNEKHLIEKFVEEEISETEILDLFQELNSNSEMTDELQQNLYMDELMEQSFKEGKSADVFLKNLTERIQEENKAVKMRTGKFNKLSSGSYRKPVIKKPKRKAPAPILIFSAIAACFAIGLTVLVVKSSESTAPGSSTAPAVSSNLFIQDIKGTVNVNRAGSTMELKDGDFILKGDVLTAGANSSGTLNFISEKTRIIMNSESEFAIESEIQKTETNKVFNVQKGRVYFDVAHQKDGFNFLIKSTMADSTIIGTRLEVKAQKDSTTVKVFEGLVRVRSKFSGDVVDVPGNHYVNIMDASFPNICSISRGTPKVIGFSLVNARSDKLVEGYEILKDGIVLEQSQIPAYLSIRINTSNSDHIEGVKTRLIDSKGQIVTFNVSNYEKVLPYSMTGDKITGDFFEWKPDPGEYILEADVINLRGMKTDSASLTFTIR